MRILVVDDDPLSSRMVQFLLSEQGYTVDLIDNALGVLPLVARQLPDLLLLDVNLPQLNGFDLYRQLHEQGYDIPVIFVTAKGEVEDRVLGLELGADDYICKPFQPAELTARIAAVLRRYHRARAVLPEPTVIGEIEIDPIGQRVVLPLRGAIALTPTEMKVLLRLARSPGHPVARNTLLAHVWGDEYDGESNIVDVYIRRLRRKLENDPAHPRLIQAARGIGYILCG